MDEGQRAVAGVSIDHGQACCRSATSMHGDEREVATELKEGQLLAMELARLMLAPVRGIQDLASVEFSSVTGRHVFCLIMVETVTSHKSESKI
jgi:hypothetical protein